MPTPFEAYHQAPPGDSVIGWKLDRAERDALLARFAPRYAKPIADHVTLRSRVAEGAPVPSSTAAVIVGRGDDGRGVEAMVVRIEGSCDRPDGSTYHITWSLAEGREAKESNEVLREHGWTPITPPVTVQLHGACFPRS